MFTFGLRAYAGVAIGVAVAAAVALSYHHYSELVKSNARLTGRTVALENEVLIEKARADASERAIDYWEQAARAQAKALDDLTIAQREASAYSRELKNAFSKHDIGNLAQAKPGLIERRVNSGSNRALRLLEQSTQVPRHSETAADAPVTGPRTSETGDATLESSGDGR